MATVFIAGSMNIKHLDSVFIDRLDNVLESKLDIVVGDADGVDTSVQDYLVQRGASSVTVFCSGSSPRNNIGRWRVKTVESAHKVGSRAFFTEKDVEMAHSADYGLMLWDAKSTGTLSNVIELLAQKKKSVVFVNKAKVFVVVGEVAQLEHLLAFMSESARLKAEQKIDLSEKLEALKHDQSAFVF
jgi:hypothetical protein